MLVPIGPFSLTHRRAVTRLHRHTASKSAGLHSATLPCRSLYREVHSVRILHALGRDNARVDGYPGAQPGMATTRETGSFAALLRQYRAAAGLSQEELAEQAGLSRRGISDLERGTRRFPYPATARRLAQALGLGAAQQSALLAAAHSSKSSEPSVAAGFLPRPLSSFVGRER